jgi:hypothetical protein
MSRFGLTPVAVAKEVTPEYETGMLLSYTPRYGIDRSAWLAVVGLRSKAIGTAAPMRTATQITALIHVALRRRGRWMTGMTSASVKPGSFSATVGC